MDEWTDERMNEQMNEWMNKWTEGEQMKMKARMSNRAPSAAGNGMCILLSCLQGNMISGFSAFTPES